MAFARYPAHGTGGSKKLFCQIVLWAFYDAFIAESTIFFDNEGDDVGTMDLVRHSLRDMEAFV